MKVYSTTVNRVPSGRGELRTGLATKMHPMSIDGPVRISQLFE